MYILLNTFYNHDWQNETMIMSCEIIEKAININININIHYRDIYKLAMSVYIIYNLCLPSHGEVYCYVLEYRRGAMQNR